MKEFVIFTNPLIRFRKEAFGGLVVYKGETYLAEPNVMEAIQLLLCPRKYTEATNIVDQETLEQMFKHSFILRITVDEAKKAGTIKGEAYGSDQDRGISER